MLICNTKNQQMRQGVDEMSFWSFVIRYLGHTDTHNKYRFVSVSVSLRSMKYRRNKRYNQIRLFQNTFRYFKLFPVSRKYVLPIPCIINVDNYSTCLFNAHYARHRFGLLHLDVMWWCIAGLGKLSWLSNIPLLEGIWRQL